MKRKVHSLISRIRRGEVIKPLYLTYYYAYLALYDRRHGTQFANSQAPEDMGSAPSGGTGNFPAHPRLVRRFLKEAGLNRDDALIDVGHGSGIVLHVASGMGFTNLTGVEYGLVPYELSVTNVGDRATLIHGNALEVDLSRYDAVSFFSPFRGDLALSFFERIPETVRVLLTINHDRIIEPVIEAKGFRAIQAYQHPIYENFNSKIWSRGQ